jgi:hypothetical protein
MQIRVALIPLIAYTPPNDLATHNNVYNDRIFDIYYNIIYYNCSKSFSPWVLDKLSYDLTYYIYVCRRFAR